MLHVLRSYPFTINLTFHEPTNLVAAGGRKKLALSAHRQVQNGVANTSVGFAPVLASDADVTP